MTKDSNLGGATVVDHVDIVEDHGVTTADGFVEVDPASPPIGDDETRGALAPARVTWVTDLGAVIGTGHELPTYVEVGAVLRLGEPEVSGAP